MSLRSFHVRAIIAALALLFAWRASIDLHNVRTVSGDEAIILSITERLSEDGRLGTPILEGFRGAGQNYFVVLPGQNVWQLPLVRMLGLDVASVRVLSVIAAVATVLLSSALAWRWFGPRQALLCALLLTVWRSGAVDMDFGLPLLSVARSARYDISVVALTLGAVLLFDSWARTRTGLRAFLTGILCGAAALTQFLGAFLAPALLTGAFLLHRESAWRFLAWFAAGCALVIIPWAFIVGMHLPDAAAQFSIAHAARLDRGFGTAGGPLLGLWREPLRYLAALRFVGLGPWLFVLGAIPAFILAASPRADDVDAAPAPARMLRILALALLAQLALLEPTKAPVYGLLLYPLTCIALAAAFIRLLERAPRARRDPVGLLAAGLLLLIVGEGLAVYVHDARTARRLAHYDDVTSVIARAATDPGAILGSTRWWWGLRERGYVPFWGVEMRWEDERRTSGRSLPVPDVLRREGIAFVLDAADLRADAARAHPALGQPLLAILEACESRRHLGTFTGYGALDLVTLDASCVGDAASSTPNREDGS